MATKQQQLQTLAAIKTAGEALAQAEQLANSVDQEKQAAAKLVPDLVQSLLREGLIDAGDQTLAREKLASHAGALTVVRGLVKHCHELRADAARKLAASGNGQPAPEDGMAKAASSIPSYYPLGGRPGYGEHRPSDMALLRLTGATARS